MLLGAHAIGRTDLNDDVERVDDARDVTEQRQQEVNPEMFAQADLQEDAERG